MDGLIHMQENDTCHIKDKPHDLKFGANNLPNGKEYGKFLVPHVFFYFADFNTKISSLS